MDDGAKKGEENKEKRDRVLRLECLLSIWLCLPQWTLQALALLGSQYREAEEDEKEERSMGTSRRGCTAECLHECDSDNV